MLYQKRQRQHLVKAAATTTTAEDTKLRFQIKYNDPPRVDVISQVHIINNTIQAHQTNEGEKLRPAPFRIHLFQCVPDAELMASNELINQLEMHASHRRSLLSCARKQSIQAHT